MMCKYESQGQKQNRAKQQQPYINSHWITPSFTDEVVHVLIILVADEFRDFLIRRSQAGGPLDRPRLLERTGIIERGFKLKMSEVRTTDPGRHAQLFRMGIRFSEPCLIVETNRIDDQCVP